MGKTKYSGHFQDHFNQSRAEEGEAGWKVVDTAGSVGCGLGESIEGGGSEVKQLGFGSTYSVNWALLVPLRKSKFSSE